MGPAWHVLYDEIIVIVKSYPKKLIEIYYIYNKLKKKIPH